MSINSHNMSTKHNIYQTFLYVYIKRLPSKKLLTYVIISSYKIIQKQN